MPTKPIEKRFHDFHMPVTETGCWLWTGKLDRSGYGYLVHDERPRRAHRMSWKLHVGPIPEGLHVCHRCDVRSCVNPAHLFLGTARDNIRDCWAKGRGSLAARKADGSMPTRLTRDAVVTIRERCAAGARQADVAREFGIVPSYVWQIVHRYVWGHV